MTGLSTRKTWDKSLFRNSRKCNVSTLINRGNQCKKPNECKEIRRSRALVLSCEARIVSLERANLNIVGCSKAATQLSQIITVGGACDLDSSGCSVGPPIKDSRQGIRVSAL